MSFDQFIKENDGKGLDWDGSYGFQCYDLAHAYAVKVVGQDIPSAPAAKDLWTKSTPGYDKVKNDPTAVPQKGDIVVWGTGVGPYGHVAVFIDGNVSSFTSFDENWPVGSVCHKQSHNYNGVLGWLHPKTTVSDALSVPKVDFERMVRKSTAYDLLCKHLGFDTTSTDGAKLIDEFEKARRSITEKEAELQTTRVERDKALSQVCPNPGAHADNNSGTTDVVQPDSGTDSPNSDSDTNSSNIPPASQEATAPWLDALIAAIKRWFR